MCPAKYMGIYIMAIASERKLIMRLHQSKSKAGVNKGTIHEQGIAIVTRCENHHRKMWTTMLVQGRSASTEEEYEEVEGEESLVEQAHK